MRTREDVHEALVDILESNHVYFNPPDSIKMIYPCFRYEFTGIKQYKADNGPYVHFKKYTVTYLTTNVREPNEIINEMLNAFEYCSVDRNYASDGVQHTTFAIYV